MFEFLVVFCFVVLVWFFLKSSVMIIVGILELITGSASGDRVIENPLVKNVRKSARKFSKKQCTITKVETHHLGGLTLYYYDASDTQGIVQIYFEKNHPDYDRLRDLKEGNVIIFTPYKNAYNGGKKSLESAYLSLE